MPDEFKIAVSDPNCIRLIQITDTHIFASTEADFDGLDTSESLGAVIEKIKEEKHADLMIVTGDLVHDPVAEAYLKLRRQLETVRIPVFCLPGNHDKPALMHELLNCGNVHTSKLIEAGKWQMILLDTVVSDSHSGRIASDELDFLGATLEQAMQQHVLVCLHHPPVSVSSPWMDTMMLENPNELFSVLDKYEAVRGIIWGHIHQLFMQTRGNVLLYGSPSSCVQFKPLSSEYVRDELGPAYSVHELFSDGRINIETKRI